MAERLTMTSDKGGLAFTFDLDITCRPSEMQKIVKLAEKLKHYEDLEEAGRLIALPCANGDVVYWRNVAGEIKRATICGYNLSAECNDGRGYTIRPEIIGKTVFLTREEAEAALKGAKQ